MDEVNWNAFQWDGGNELWDEVHKHLESFLESETDVALSPDLTDQQRHYAAGKAASLLELQSHLKQLKDMAEQNKK
tara:strand:+ start:1013 stop:1240 length:228 start_codon:yes stop_codon:yes gene_type:complete